MKLTQEEITALNLTEEEVILWNTPFRDMSKDGILMVFNVADKVSTYHEQLRDSEKEAKKALAEEERIHAEKDKMIPLKRSFY